MQAIFIACIVMRSSSGAGMGQVVSGELPESAYLHHNNVDALLWLQTSAEWVASYRQAYALAKLRIDRAVADAAPGERLCITTDLDETLFDNSAYNEFLVRQGRNFNETGNWAEYCKAEVSKAMPGVAEFYGWLAEANPEVEVFFVTSRLEDLRAFTARNLGKLTDVPVKTAANDKPGETRLFMGGFVVPIDQPDGQPWPPGHKYNKFDHYRYIEDKLGFRTVLRLGDNASDFHPDFGSSVAPEKRLAAAERHASRWGRDWIQMPNPVYGGFLQSLKINGKPVVEDEGAALGMTDAQARTPRAPDVSPKVVFLDPWIP
jgi:predicted secreted acid phosphatase